MVVVSVFVVCNCLAMVSNILELFQISAVSVTMVSNLLVTLNSSVNLFIYCTFGERFRKEIKRLANQIKRKLNKYCFMRYKSPSSIFQEDNESVRCLKLDRKKSKSLPNIAKSISNNVYGISRSVKNIKSKSRYEIPSGVTVHTCVEMFEMDTLVKLEDKHKNLERQTVIDRLNTFGLV